MSIETPIIFCLVSFTIMAVLIYKLNKIVAKFDDILGDLR